MARLALAGDGYALSRANSLTHANWRPLFDSCEGRADSVASGLHREIEVELDWLDENWPKDLPAGVIHADMFPDNVFFLGDKLSGVIDFYFACNDFLAYEIAVCLNAWCFEADRQFNVTKARHMLQAYQKVRPLSAAEMQALPVLARGAALRFLLTRLYDWLNTPEGALVRPHDPLQFRDYLRFHKGLKGPAAYGLDQV